MLIEARRGQRAIELFLADEVDIAQSRVGLLQIIRHQLHHIGREVLHVLVELREDGTTPVDQCHLLTLGIEDQVGRLDIPVHHRRRVGACG